MTPQSDPAFEIKKALDREVGRRFDGGRFHGLDVRDAHDPGAYRDGPLARIPVPMQWIGIAAALIAAVTGLRSLYVDLVGREARPAPSARVEALSSSPQTRPDRAPALELERQVEHPPARRTAPPTKREERRPIQPPPVETEAAPAIDASDVVAEPSPPPDDVVAQAVPGPAVDVAPEPARVVEPKTARAQPDPLPFPQYGVIAGGVQRDVAGGVRLASFASQGRRLDATIREAPGVGATIVSLVGAPAPSGTAGLSETDPPAKPSSRRPPSKESSYYIRLLSGARIGLTAEREPALLLTKMLSAEPPPDPEEIWGSDRHKSFLRRAFDLKTVVAVAGVRTAPVSPDVAAKADLVATMAGGVYRLVVKAAPFMDGGQHRFELRLATMDSGPLQSIEGSFVVDANRVVVLALPDPRRIRWAGGIASSGTTVFVVLSSRSEDPESNPVAEQDLEPPILIDGPEPRYPDEARAQRATGRVVLRVTVREDGSVADPEVVESPDVPESKYLVEAAIDAVLERRYIPARRHGETVDAYVTITIEFKEEGSDGLRAP